MIYSYENSLRADACIEYLNTIDGIRKYEQTILLPIPSTRDNKTILNTKVCINELMPQINEQTFISSYGLDNDVSDAIRDTGAFLVDLALDEGFLLENAELTALAALGILLTTTR